MISRVKHFAFKLHHIAIYSFLNGNNPASLKNFIFLDAGADIGV